jgi:hypothetical protein
MDADEDKKLKDVPNIVSRIDCSLMLDSWPDREVNAAILHDKSISSTGLGDGTRVNGQQTKTRY